MAQLYPPTQKSKKYKGTFIQVPSLVSEQHFNTQYQIEDLYESQKVQFSSNLRRPDTLFRHEQRHQLADAILGSNEII